MTDELSGAVKDLTGKKFGMLTVTGYAGIYQEHRQRGSLWICRCDCGNICQVPGYLLTNGRRKSCGCLRVSSKDLVGKRYGKLTILEEDKENQTTLRKVICRCDCGREKSIAFRDLRSGQVTSCGCDRQKYQKSEDVLERQYDERLEAKRKAFVKGEITCIKTLDEWVYIWLREVLPQVVKPATIRMYAETMERHIHAPLGHRPLEEITENVIKKWLYSLENGSVRADQGTRMSEGTVRNTLSVLSGCLRDAQKYRLIDENPCTNVVWTYQSRNLWESRKWLNEEQLLKLRPLIDGYRSEEGYPLGIGFQLILYGGLSLSEAAALRWKDVDCKKQQVHVQYFVEEHRNKEENKDTEYGLEPAVGRRRRIVPIPKFLCKNLEQVRRKYKVGPEDFVIYSSGPGPVRVDRMRSALMRRGKACGLNGVTPRMLRDTYAMRAVQAGGTSDMIAELMGFASPEQVIRKYMPHIPGAKKELVEKMYQK